MLTTTAVASARWRWLIPVGLTGLPVLVIGLLAAAGPDLPDLMPTYWDFGGRVDGTMRLATLTIGTIAVASVATLLAVLIGFSSLDGRVRRLVVLVCAFAAYYVGAMFTVTMTAAAGAATAAEVELPEIGVAIAIAVATLAAVVVQWTTPVARVPRRSGAEPDSTLPRHDLRDGERAVYTTVLSSKLFTTISVGCMALGVVVSVGVDWVFGGFLMIVGLVTVTFSVISVRVDGTGVTVRLGLWSRIVVPLEQIEQAKAEEIRPLEWGGWGYQVLPRRRAVVLRAGPGLVLDLSEDRGFAVTLDDPAEPAALLNGLLTR